MLIQKIVISTILLFTIINSFSRSKPGELYSSGGDCITEDNRPKVYIDCNNCDLKYIKEEISYVNYVRDVHQSEIYVLITGNNTGGGGRLYNLDFEGQKGFEGLEFNINYTSLNTDTEFEIRKGLTNKLSMGLLFFVAHTKNAKNIDLEITTNEQAVETESDSIDKWNYWVFDIYGGGEVQKETSQENFTLRGNLSARRITDEWKFELESNNYYRERNIKNDDGGFKTISRNNNAKMMVVKSINDKWSTGLFGDISSNTYINTKLKYSLSPGIEYSIFPYSEVNEREFTLVYKFDYDFVEYYKETIYLKTKEHLPNQEFQMKMEYKQKWGNARLRLNGQQYLHDLSKYSVGLDGRISWRVVKGLSLRVSGNLKMVHDQLYLANKNASLEEIIARQQKIKTTYESGINLGVSFTFGSMYNNVVNTRM